MKFSNVLNVEFYLCSYLLWKRILKISKLIDLEKLNKSINGISLNL
jgi:hypothetical protein